MDPFPTRKAEELLKEWGVSSASIDPIKIATEHQITCQPMPSSSGGVSGILMKLGENFGIMYATHIEVEGFQRFSIAHELGHYFLPEHPEKVFHSEDQHYSHAGFVSDDKYEKEADQFACGLLMPNFLFDRELQSVGVGLAAVKELAQVFGTSLTATAIRYAQRQSEPAAIVVSSSGKIEYCFMSDELKEYPGLRWIKKNTPVPNGTATKLFTPEKVLRCDEEGGETDLSTWFGSDMGGELYEEVIGLGAYGKSLTVLDCSGLPDLEELEEEEDLEESWKPRFKR